MIGFTPENMHDAINLGSTSLLLNNINREWAKPDLSDLENDLLNNSMRSISWQFLDYRSQLPRPRRGLRGIVFTRSVCLSVCVSCVCVSVCLCVRPIFWYFIYRLLEEISIWNLYRILIGLYSIHWKNDLHRSMVKVTGRYIAFWRYSHITKTEPWNNFNFVHRHLLGYPIRWHNKN